MGIVKETPKDLPSTDTLKIKDKVVQGALIEAAFVKFAGSSVVALEDPPELDEPRTYIVKATCKQVATALRKDNEERVTVTMEIDSCYEKGKVPIVDENQGSLFDDADDEGEPGIVRPPLAAVTDDPEALGDLLDDVDRPGFSDQP